MIDSLPILKTCDCTDFSSVKCLMKHCLKCSLFVILESLLCVKKDLSQL